MTTPKILPVALLVAAGLFSAPAASADARMPIEVAFTYNPGDAAQDIYSDLQRTARHACQISGRRTLALRKSEWKCEKQLLDDGVAKMGRADIAVLHNGYFTAADTRG
jgi:hypothetical protein